MKYRLRSDHSVTLDAADVGCAATVQIPTDVFLYAFELAPTGKNLCKVFAEEEKHHTREEKP